MKHHTRYIQISIDTESRIVLQIQRLAGILPREVDDLRVQ
jgi:hypothetical protein